MIPLAHWLASGGHDAHVGAGFPGPQSPATDTPRPEQEPDRAGPHESTADMSGYIRELEDSLECVKRQAEQARNENQKRETELLERCGLEWTQIIAGHMDAIATGLRSDLEIVMNDLLAPFLANAVRQAAIRQLVDLIEQTVTGSADLELVVNVPQDLHETLAAHFAKRGLTATFCDAAEISVSTGSQKHRFEELGKKWLATLAFEAT